MLKNLFFFAQFLKNVLKKKTGEMYWLESFLCQISFEINFLELGFLRKLFFLNIFVFVFVYLFKKYELKKIRIRLFWKSVN